MTKRTFNKSSKTLL